MGQLYARWTPKPLDAAAYLDALGDVTGVRFLDESVGQDQLRFIDRVRWEEEPTRGAERRDGCAGSAVCEVEFEDSLAGRLAQIAGPAVNQRITAPDGWVQRRATELRGRERECVIELYERALSREPTAAEEGHWVERLRATDEPELVWEDLVWSLLTSELLRKNW